MFGVGGAFTVVLGFSPINCVGRSSGRAPNSFRVCVGWIRYVRLPGHNDCPVSAALLIATTIYVTPTFENCFSLELRLKKQGRNPLLYIALIGVALASSAMMRPLPLVSYAIDGDAAMPEYPYEIFRILAGQSIATMTRLGIINRDGVTTWQPLDAPSPWMNQRPPLDMNVGKLSLNGVIKYLCVAVHGSNRVESFVPLLSSAAVVDGCCRPRRW
ncbi:hypothetical protein M8C21_026577 [Ambrosia artemisiifolia]|uniref:Uncharacterized protein n=1 Tax=Ambrosia artemisiifolia TaxID=4212 RepID=A0AAD5CJV1_AMBAR|nr:hypothetical protein M8C21_026577 [Ambrosia artemisiifolia]